jgi:uncharacterized protein (UPF0276 family)
VDGGRAAARVGIGLRAAHYSDIDERRPDLAFLEVHSENYFGAGGAALAWLERLRATYPISLHGVGLSLGSADTLDARHLSRLAALVARFEPILVSEHLSWSSAGGHHANDLLPLPFSEEALAHVSARIAEVQDRLGRRLAVENVSSYASLPGSTMPECEFVAEVVRRSGCELLLDVNNVWVNAANHGFDPRGYLEALAGLPVAEIHLAGFERAPGLLVDTHAAPVAEEVWALYASALERFGPRPTLIEWDADIPPLDTLLAQAERARSMAA